jgi:hypothetical protein
MVNKNFCNKSGSDITELEAGSRKSEVSKLETTSDFCLRTSVLLLPNFHFDKVVMIDLSLKRVQDESNFSKIATLKEFSDFFIRFL